MPVTSKVLHDTDEYDFGVNEEDFEFEGLKPKFMKTIDLNAQLCPPNL